MPGLTGDVTSSAGSTATTVAKIQGTTVSGTTGTGAAVLATSPALTTPNIGVATATTVQGLTGQLTPNAAGGIDVGAAALPFSGVRIGAAATNNIRVTGTATAARTATLQDATDTFVMRATTDTLTNKNLTAPAISDPTITGNTNLKRIKANQGSSLVVGDVGGLTGWGSTATVASVAGNDTIGQIVITSNGTGQAFNAGFTLTFHDGTWTTAPLCLVVRADGFSPQGAMIPNGATATTAAFFFNAVPVAGVTYIADFMCVGR
jgi:hypothetical protein